jgi:probable ATP-dependent RNA helicase DDX4
MSDWSDDETSTPAAQPAAARTGGGGSGCRNCGEDGHFARECPTKSSGGGGGGSGCRNCGEDGHFARDCPTKKSGGEGGDGCRKCGEEGHMARDCSIPDKCRKCNEEGHMAKDCSIPDKCRKCQAEGHMARDCELPDTCRRCGSEDHKVAECSEEEKTRTIVGEDGTEREIYVPADVKDDDLFSQQSTISSGINFEKYDKIPINVDGENVPAGIRSFEESPLRQLVKDNVGKSGYKVPTPIQKHAIPAILNKRDLLACAQTGSGKTAAFLCPIISSLLDSNAESNSGERCQTPQAVIITPTRELAIQIYEQSRKFAMGSMIKSGIAYGGTSVGSQLNKIEKGCNILVATPGRLLGFVEMGRISFEKIEFFILDEADRMLAMGFEGDIAKCINNPTMPKKEDRTTLLFSATFPSEVRLSAKEYLKKDRISITIGVIGAPCADVKQTFLSLDRNGKKAALLAILNDEERDPTEKIMVFVNTKKQADFLASMLSGMGKPSTSIHGDRMQREREQALNDFRSGHRPIIVCTAVAARGLDIPGVQHVVNYDMPKDVDEYVHRVGRSGRVGNLGKATSFFDASSDGEVQGPLVQLLQGAGVEMPDFLTSDGMDGFGDGGGGLPVGMPASGGGGAAAAEDDDW